jgi:peptide/nickel transport system ATP-binding protein
VENLQVGYPVRGVFGTRRHVMAVNDVSFQIQKGETFGLVGRVGLRQNHPGPGPAAVGAHHGGKIWFEGPGCSGWGPKQLRQLRRDMQIVFQDPFSSLDPRMSIGAAIAEPLRIHKVAKASAIAGAGGLPARTGGADPDCMNRFPHEFSGGQRQRICIARALALNPKFIICDESVSALDVSVQAQVLNLLKELQAEFDLTYIFISHDLAVVKFMSDRIMVMNQGKVEEIGPAEQIYRHPSNPTPKTDQGHSHRHAGSHSGTAECTFFVMEWVGGEGEGDYCGLSTKLRLSTNFQKTEHSKPDKHHVLQPFLTVCNIIMEICWVNKALGNLGYVVLTTFSPSI